MTSIGLVSDIHVGHPEIDEQRIKRSLHRLVEEFEERGITHVFSIGDQIHDRSYEQDKENLEWLSDCFSDFEFYALIGNHDVGELSVKEFEEIIGSSRQEIVTELEGSDVVLLDTGSVNDIQHVGQIDESGFELCYKADNPLVLTHFPITYTSAFLSSSFFGEYPEGVFAINKYHFEEARAEGPMDIRAIFTGHLHIEHEYYDSFGKPNVILAPFMDLAEYKVAGDAYVYDLEKGSLEKISV